MTLLDSGLYILLLATQPLLDSNSQQLLWSLLCDCGKYAFENHLKAKGMERIQLRDVIECQRAHSRVNLFVIPICSARLRKEESSLLWELVFLMTERLSDLTPLEVILLYVLDPCASYDLLDSFLSRVKSKHLALPSSVLSLLQSMSLPLSSRTIVLQLLFEGKQHDVSVSPTLNHSAYWVEEALDFFLCSKRSSISIELQNTVDPKLQFIMTNQNVTHQLHTILCIIHQHDESSQQGIIEHMLQIQESLPIRLVNLYRRCFVHQEDLIETMKLLLKYHPYKTCSILRQQNCILTKECCYYLQCQTC